MNMNIFSATRFLAIKSIDQYAVKDFIVVMGAECAGLIGIFPWNSQTRQIEANKVASRSKLYLEQANQTWERCNITNVKAEGNTKAFAVCMYECLVDANETVKRYTQTETVYLVFHHTQKTNSVSRMRG